MNVLSLGTKKRRIVSIVVLWNQSVFQRLMLLDYQIRLDLASGMISFSGVEWVYSLCVEQNILYLGGKAERFLVA